MSFYRKNMYVHNEHNTSNAIFLLNMKYLKTPNIKRDKNIYNHVKHYIGKKHYSPLFITMSFSFPRRVYYITMVTKNNFLSFCFTFIFSHLDLSDLKEKQTLCLKQSTGRVSASNRHSQYY